MAGIGIAHTSGHEQGDGTGIRFFQCRAHKMRIVGRPEQVVSPKDDRMAGIGRHQCDHLPADTADPQ